MHPHDDGHGHAHAHTHTYTDAHTHGHDQLLKFTRLGVWGRRQSMEIKRSSTAKAHRCADKHCQRAASIRNFYQATYGVLISGAGSAQGMGAAGSSEGPEASPRRPDSCTWVLVKRFGACPNNHVESTVVECLSPRGPEIAECNFYRPAHGCVPWNVILRLHLDEHLWTGS
jgi:hypothetical protein